MVQSRCRISYVVPPPLDPVPRLHLPPSGTPRIGSTSPLILPDQNVSSGTTDEYSPKHLNHPRHRLGVASLAIDTSTLLAGRNTPEGILYTGGRDGMVMSWDLGFPMKKRRPKFRNGSIRRSVGRWEIMTGWADDVIDEEAEEADDRYIGSDGDILGEVSANNSRRKKMLARKTSIPFENEWETDLDAFTPEIPTHFRQCAQTHSDWVNDILLCNYNQTVISASSDGTIKAWNPHSPTSSEPSTIGSHSDYVRCLAHCREKNWLASGSFDRTVKLWDLSRSVQGGSANPLMTLNPPDTTAPKSSVYAIAADPSGHAIASGAPERVVRIWDPRSGKRIGKLVGHTDNIRAILISEDSRYLLTGSTDASIKLWSLVSQRCLHTFTYHTDSVWSLFSTHPSLEMFYSGDKSGLVCRVDVEDCSEVSEGECVVLCQDTGGLPTASSEGINKIIAMDDNVLWTASGSSRIQRWRVPQRRSDRASALVLDGDADRTAISESPVTTTFNKLASNTDSSPPLRSMQRLPTLHPPSPSPSPRIKGASALSLQDSVVSEQWLRVQGPEDESMLYGIPLRSLVRLTSPLDPYTTYTLPRSKDPEVATLYSAASIKSVPRASALRSPQRTFITPHTTPLLSSRTEDTTHQVSSARADYEEREIAADAIPLCGIPDFVIEGDHGLVRSIMLNDRIHALTVDTSGEVAIWDVVRAVCCGKFSPEEVAAASHPASTASTSGADLEGSPREALEAVRERIDGEAVVSPWSSVDTKTGVLTVHMNEKCFDAEVYADEVGFAHDRQFTDESKLNIGKWVLRNLFLLFIHEQQRVRRNQSSRSSGSTSDHSKSSTKVHGSSTVISAPEMIPAVPPATTFSITSSPLLAPMIAIMPDGKLSLPGLTPVTYVAASTINEAMHSARLQTIEGSQPSASVTPSAGDYFPTWIRSPAPHGVTPGPDDVSGSVGPGSLKPDSSLPATPGGGLMGRLKSLGKISGSKKVPELGANLASPGVVPPEHRVNLDELTPEPPMIKTPRQTLLLSPLTPPTTVDGPSHTLPPNVSLIVSEEASPGWTTLYRGTVASAGHDMSTLEEVLPLLFLDYLLRNRTPPAPSVKLGFILLPWPNKDPDGEQLPELSNGASSRLTASRSLRVRKLITHVQESLDLLSTSPERSGSLSRSSSSLDLSPEVKGTRPRSEDVFEIICNEVVLPLNISLAAVRQFVWRQSAELVMYYRRKSVTQGDDR